MSSGTLFFLQPTGSTTDPNPNFANAQGDATFSNYSQPASGSLTSIQLQELISGGVASAIVDASAVFINNPAFTSLFTEAFAEGEDGEFEVKNKSQAQVNATFDIAANDTFSFDFLANNSLTVKEIENPDIEYNKAKSKSTFLVLDTTDPNNPEILDFFGIKGKLISSEQLAETDSAASGNISFTTEVNQDVDGNNGEDFLDATVFSGTYSRTFSSDTRISVIETNTSATKLLGDTFINNLGSNVIYGSIWDDELNGTNGADKIYASRRRDTLRGYDGDDILEGGSGRDQLYGNNDDDKLHGGDGRDLLKGGRGQDTLVGGDDKDILAGNRGDDSLRGGDDQDALYGNLGNDTLSGEEGDDILDGGWGSDVLTGGAGEDVFVFDWAGGFFNFYSTLQFDGSTTESAFATTDSFTSSQSIASFDASVAEASFATLDSQALSKSITSVDSLSQLEIAELEESLLEEEKYQEDGDDNWLNEVLELDDSWVNDEGDDDFEDDILTNFSVDSSLSSQQLLAEADSAVVGESLIFDSNTSSYFWYWGDSDIITDFTVGTDKIAFQGAGNVNFSNWLSQMISQGQLTNTSSGAQFSFSNGDTLLLEGVNVNSLSGSDFISV